MKVYTDHGILPIKNVLKGMYVKTKDGMRIVISNVKQKGNKIKYYIVVGKLRIRFDKDQIFYHDGVPIEGYLLKAGDTIDTTDGMFYIHKKNLVINNRLYYNLIVDSTRSEFLLYNDIIVSM